MYSFHATEQELDAYYETAKQAYENVFRRCGLGDITYLTYASGGDFCRYSHEYQTITPYGEDLIYIGEDCNVAVNKELIDELEHTCPSCGNKELREQTSIEVGNIFKLMTRYSSAFGLSFQDERGQRCENVYMGCYGIGSSRLIGAIVEASHDENGIIWPEQVAPYDVHLVSLAQTEEKMAKADAVYQSLQVQGKEVLYDDRKKTSPGAKFSESDLIGIPTRMIVSPRSLKAGVIEIKDRKTGEVKEVEIGALIRI